MTVTRLRRGANVCHPSSLSLISSSVLLLLLIYDGVVAVAVAVAAASSVFRVIN